jgi:protein-S-isoprenylcysteine O-methyltransferase Ste14
MENDGLIWYALLWLSFGAGHSLLAMPAGRGLLERLAGRADRLLYNLIAAIHLALVLWLGMLLLGGQAGFALPLPLRLAMDVAIGAGALILLIAGRSYDPARFFGLAQMRAGTPDRAIVPETLVTAGLNGVVRHPLYLGLLLLLWGDARAPFTGATALFATLYVLIGIHFEERKLKRLYGEVYTAYRARVPMLFPRFWRG